MKDKNIYLLKLKDIHALSITNELSNQQRMGLTQIERYYMKRYLIVLVQRWIK